MIIHIATDHAGLEVKEVISRHLSENGHKVVDHGAYTFDTNDDYPDFIVPAAEGVARDLAEGHEALGVVFGGSGNGEQIAANKVRGIRAALVWNEDTARLAREHNDANVISLGARQHSQDDMLRLIDLFIATPFSGEERHERRIEKIGEYVEP